MRHFPRLNRVAYGILRRQHPMVLTLLEQNDRVKLRSHRVSGGIPATVRRQSSIVGVDGPAASCAKVWLSTSNLKDRPHEP
jgi:hypothetical protein